MLKISKFKTVPVCILLLGVLGCASNGTGTLGNGRIDIDLGDGKLFGSEKAYLIGVTAAQIAVYRNPSMAFSVKSKLIAARVKAAEFEEEFPMEEASSIVMDLIRDECGIYCNTVAGKSYIEEYILAASQIIGDASLLTVSPTEFIDQLLGQIDLVEASTK